MYLDSVLCCFCVYVCVYSIVYSIVFVRMRTLMAVFDIKILCVCMCTCVSVCIFVCILYMCTIACFPSFELITRISCKSIIWTHEHSQSVLGLKVRLFDLGFYLPSFTIETLVHLGGC